MSEIIKLESFSFLTNAEVVITGQTFVDICLCEFAVYIKHCIYFSVVVKL